jgi:hypothetical protein
MSVSRFFVVWRMLLVAIVFCLAQGWTPQADAQNPTIVSGFNLDGFDPGSEPFIPVPFISAEGHWVLDANLIFDPKAPPMTKAFQSPIGSTGGPILLDATQPFPFPIWENFFLIPPGTAGAPGSQAVSDWHEEIITPGWEWVLPGDPRFPNLFPPGQTLITRNGAPWDSFPIPHPDGTDNPSRVWVKFPPIEPGNILDVHKGLLWVGTLDNRIWGDDPTTERQILVFEYPTPEPSSVALALLGGMGLVVVARRLRK